ncbi:hypothetical protein POX_a00701 [Penicillium oxalicum]|uniref:Uncharacterized protein n=1 Tax=Penicillium oxalicum (strain 114-2 / CGMCC 5302) TaxID=933388 RepID=S8BGU1_PENO1|nr:hypothetical protein POX_a00701 [Penicillium oxalicum]EPS34327.1 hypothetical protein PDE_09291 [Penicillium oxalicum 114-2]KAI2794111.1 hypothetical protein POX_a00701 [Penicillium oxalicum]
MDGIHLEIQCRPDLGELCDVTGGSIGQSHSILYAGEISVGFRLRPSWALATSMAAPAKSLGHLKETQPLDFHHRNSIRHRVGLEEGRDFCWAARCDVPTATGEINAEY